MQLYVGKGPSGPSIIRIPWFCNLQVRYLELLDEQDNSKDIRYYCVWYFFTVVYVKFSHRAVIYYESGKGHVSSFVRFIAHSEYTTVETVILSRLWMQLVFLSVIGGFPFPFVLIAGIHRS